MIRFYYVAVVPAVNFAARWLSRACLLAGVTILIAVAAGWIAP